MLTNPRPGTRVEIRYNPRVRDAMPLHGRHGTVVTRGTGSPRNHVVSVDDCLYVVPCGNLFSAKTGWQ